jgi:hypothetical protein
MVAKEKVNPKQQPLYLVVTPLDQLVEEDGIVFEGETERDRIINQADFVAFRDIYLRFESAISIDTRLAIIRALKQMVKPESLLAP